MSHPETTAPPSSGFLIKQDNQELKGLRITTASLHRTHQRQGNTPACASDVITNFSFVTSALMITFESQKTATTKKREINKHDDDSTRGSDRGSLLTNGYAEKGLHPQTDAHVNRGRDDGVEMLLQGSSPLLETSCSGQGSDWAGALR